MHFCFKCLKVLAWQAWGSYFGNLETIQDTKRSSQMLEKALYMPSPMFPVKFPSPACPSPTAPGSLECAGKHTLLLRIRLLPSEVRTPARLASAGASSGHNRALCVRADISRSFGSPWLWLFVIKNNGTGHQVSSAQLAAASCLLEERHETA